MVVVVAASHKEAPASQSVTEMVNVNANKMFCTRQEMEKFVLRIHSLDPFLNSCICNFKILFFYSSITSRVFEPMCTTEHFMVILVRALLIGVIAGLVRHFANCLKPPP